LLDQTAITGLMRIINIQKLKPSYLDIIFSFVLCLSCPLTENYDIATVNINKLIISCFERRLLNF